MAERLERRARSGAGKSPRVEGWGSETPDDAPWLRMLVAASPPGDGSKWNPPKLELVPVVNMDVYIIYINGS